ncbi:MAG: YicC family protein [Proteobacteria bacterium]|nr:YicC family protein [Pseudomonadota bacterium]
MTGYGRASFSVGSAVFDVEVRTVNHRYLDARVKLPRVLADREAEIKARIQAALSRGKVDLSVSHPADVVVPPRIEIDREAAQQYLDVARELAGLVPGTLDVTALLSLPGVARSVEVELPAEPLAEELGRAVDSALEALDAMRRAEGEALARELGPRLDRVVESAVILESRSELVVQSVRQKLRKRAEQLESETGLLDEARLHQEVVIAADRLDITEEIARLRSHVAQFRQIMAEADRGTPVGRRLDFLLQEMAREANTVGAKANDAPLAHVVVEVKAEIERIREQVQNIE